MVSAGGSQLAATARRATGSWRAARKGEGRAPARPQGVPLEVGGPPARCATSSWRAARKGFHFPAGRPRPTGLPRPPRHGYQNACAPGTRESPLATGPPILGAPHIPGTFLGVLEVLFVLAKAPVPRSGLAPTPATSPPTPIGHWQHWQLATLPHWQHSAPCATPRYTR